jgi:transposase-like protein
MGKRVISKNVKVAAMKAYVADGKTLRETGKEFGVNPETLRKWLGDKVRPRGHHHKKGVVVKSKVSVASTNKVASKNKEKENAIVSSSTTKNQVVTKLGRANSRWNLTEDEILRDAVLSGLTVNETSDILERSPIAIYCRKVHLIENGFIEDPSLRFPVPTGIKRGRKRVENVFSEPQMETLVQPEVAQEIKVENSTETPAMNSSIELSDLAKLVKEFGVNITVSMTSKGMEVKMCN